MSSRLWGRRATFAMVPEPGKGEIITAPPDPGLQFETTHAKGIRIAFDITRTLSIEPNPARIDLYNLSRESQRRVEQSDHNYCTLLAGYDEPGTLYQGDIRRVKTEPQGAERVTTFQVGDAELDFKLARVNLSWSPNAVFRTVFRDLTKNIRQGTKKALQRLEKGDIQGAAERFARGWAASGRTFDELDRLVRSQGLELSVQDDELQLLAAGEAVDPGTAVVLTPQTGLLGEPAIDPATGWVTCAAWLIPELRPGRVVDVQSERVTGRYRAERCRYVGDTHGQQWFVEIDGSPYAA